MELLEQIYEFLKPYLGASGIAALLLVLASIHIWYLHHKNTLLQDRLALAEERRQAMFDDMQRMTVSPTIEPAAGGNAVPADQPPTPTPIRSRIECMRLDDRRPPMVADPKRAAKDETSGRPAGQHLKHIYPPTAALQEMAAKSKFRQGFPPVLVVDDDASFLALLEAVFKSAGYSVRSAMNGLSALHLIEQELPSLLVLDVMMPGMTGIEVAKRLREKGTTIPIIFCSGVATPDEIIAAGLQIGNALKFISKPMRYQELLSLAEGMLTRLAHSDAPLATQENPPRS